MEHVSLSLASALTSCFQLEQNDLLLKTFHTGVLIRPAQENVVQSSARIEVTNENDRRIIGCNELPQNRCSRLLYRSPTIKPHSHTLWLQPEKHQRYKAWHTDLQLTVQIAVTISVLWKTITVPTSKTYLEELDHVEFGVGLLLFCGSFAK